MDNIAKLIPHPATPADFLSGISLAFHYSRSSIDLQFIVIGHIDDIYRPKSVKPARADDLWKTTCFEMFVKRKGSKAYREFNFSPSGQWASYDFQQYRQGMQNADMHSPTITVQQNASELLLNARVDWTLCHDVEVAASAVIEKCDGTKSFWALDHPENDPDFHHPACFALELAAPATA